MARCRSAADSRTSTDSFRSILEEKVSPTFPTDLAKTPKVIHPQQKKTPWLTGVCKTWYPTSCNENFGFCRLPMIEGGSFAHDFDSTAGHSRACSLYAARRMIPRPAPWSKAMGCPWGDPHSSLPSTNGWELGVPLFWKPLLICVDLIHVYTVYLYVRTCVDIWNGLNWNGLNWNGFLSCLPLRFLVPSVMRDHKWRSSMVRVRFANDLVLCVTPHFRPASGMIGSKIVIQNGQTVVKCGSMFAPCISKFPLFGESFGTFSRSLDDMTSFRGGKEEWLRTFQGSKTWKHGIASKLRSFPDN